MTLTINGETQTVPDTIENVRQLLEYLHIQNRIVIVEVNREILQKEQHAVTRLSNGDTIELVHFVGGG
ncbi:MULTISPECIES: sulfur carrier protein ThiS [Aneurinibacillus]|uniref:Sulfur carrier protein n=1 Tax=Aneurinibacillus thermoaerophilus TaxID=143495 RepID=A0A1G7WXZ3_ANETH|nr:MULTISPECIES: sulfur carrier protein ThiS [Aneurinibacillus]AMA73889.1 thiamine biosynthesis protein ThiS [Aneurinibacillus sp. XH2]MED0674072.1 sulfur carrier protein ThiS [Aneurinibacillus thermoaerophilus]MED0678057.1 sulfur carrier protein ThiS [Aneurinibacillus thermoaerophilus]MED0737753.1 sulfur carrier protein ThiS [Aneurinibacillus thermoaerophilus]MED0755739.1 sulfur carrier protein ThiS [Aneurinibacillus thermoaerophilus]